MEDAKLQALHDTLSQIRGKKGLGTNTQYSWQRHGASQTDRHPAAASLPDNALYAHFLPEGVYDPNTKRIDDGDGRIVKRDFSDAIMDDGDNDDDSIGKNKKQKSTIDKIEKERQKEIRRAEKKAAKKAEKLKAKLEEKKRQKKLEKKLKKQQSSEMTPESPEVRNKNETFNEVSDETAERPVKVKSKKNKLDTVDIKQEDDHQAKKLAKKRKKSKDNAR
jgi:hypothetical protein